MSETAQRLIEVLTELWNNDPPVSDDTALEVVKQTLDDERRIIALRSYIAGHDGGSRYPDVEVEKLAAAWVRTLDTEAER
jgi:hypothetical protein